MSPKTVKDAYDKMHAFFGAARSKAETPESCTKKIWEPCLLHPVNCPECRNGDRCQMRPDMEAHPDKIKSCRFFRRKPGYLK